MKNKIISIFAYMLVILLVASFFSIDEYDVFHTYIGILMIIMYVVTLYVSSILLSEYKNSTSKKIKHKHMFLFLPFYLTIMMFFVTQVYFFGEIVNNPIAAIVLSITEMILFTGYIIMALIMDKIRLSDDGFEIVSIFQPKGVFMKYDEVTSIKFGWLMNTMKLRTKTHIAIIDVTLANSFILLNVIFEQTKQEIHQKAFEELGMFYKILLLRKNLEFLSYFKNIKKD